MFKLGSGTQARRKRGLAIGACTALVVTGLVGGQALAAHPEVSLAGSDFEIDTNANLVVNDAGNLDWMSVDQLSQPDALSGASDNSFGQGTKEDTEIPTVVSGQIPPQKSDLLNFGGYLETTAAGQEFLNIYWSRVQEPNGTTNMDFEFNQSSVLSGNGITPVRTAGDLLVQYDLSRGGTNPNLFLSTWLTEANGDSAADCEASNSLPCWSEKTNLTTAALATGSINTTAIAGADTDGIAPVAGLSARTFGEAQIDWDAIVGSGEGECVTFGSAYLKSRSSDSFTSELKDFIEPLSLNLSNCGGVTIRKQTDPDEADNTTLFDYTSDIVTDPATDNSTFQLADDGVNQITDVVQGDYYVEELATPTGYDFDRIDCSASIGFGENDEEITITGAKIEFTIDDAGDALDCTYTNKAQASLHVIKTAEQDGVEFDFTSTTLTPASFSLTSGGADQDFTNLAPGTYDVAETELAGWDLQSATCSDNSPVTAIVLTAGEDVTCTFHNVLERGSLVIHKDAKHAAADNEAKAIDVPGVTFTVTDGADAVVGSGVTDNAGLLCIEDVLVGDYTITETVPAGYKAVGTGIQSYTVVAHTTCDGAGDTEAAEVAEFHNMPLTDITVTVDSLIDGGTASTIDCGTEEKPTDTDANGDGSLMLEDLEPGTYTCVIVVDP